MEKGGLDLNKGRNRNAATFADVQKLGITVGGLDFGFWFHFNYFSIQIQFFNGDYQNIYCLL
jgi:hypothetical protein